MDSQSGPGGGPERPGARHEKGGCRAAPSGWGVTRISRQAERKFYFAITMAAVGLYLFSQLWER